MSLPPILAIFACLWTPAFGVTLASDLPQSRRRQDVAGGDNALKVLERITGNGESVKAGIAEARVNLEVAQMIYDARTRAGLSQSQLATLIGSKQSAIARLEDADYTGHSLTMLQRIAAALKQRVDLRFVPRRRRRSGPPGRPTRSAIAGP